jgi:hypothetical protein
LSREDEARKKIAATTNTMVNVIKDSKVGMGTAKGNYGKEVRRRY